SSITSTRRGSAGTTSWCGVRPTCSTSSARTTRGATSVSSHTSSRKNRSHRATRRGRPPCPSRPTPAPVAGPTTRSREPSPRDGRGNGKEIQLTDAIRRTLGNHPVVAYEFEGDYYDTGTVPGYLRANLMLAMKREGLREELAPLLREMLETSAEG